MEIIFWNATINYNKPLKYIISLLLFRNIYFNFSIETEEI